MTIWDFEIIFMPAIEDRQLFLSMYSYLYSTISGAVLMAHLLTAW